MQQYSPKNQAFLLAQMPTATDVRPFKAWKAAGRSVKKGEKALHVWIPKVGKAKPAELSTISEQEMREYFVRGPVFDISQTKEAATRHQKAAQSARSEHRHEQAWTDYAQAIESGDIPAELDFADWYELREETIRYQITKQAEAAQPIAPTEDETDRWLTSVIERRDGNAGNYTIATTAGAIIAQVEHHTIDA